MPHAGRQSRPADSQWRLAWLPFLFCRPACEDGGVRAIGAAGPDVTGDRLYRVGEAR